MQPMLRLVSQPVKDIVELEKLTWYVVILRKSKFQVNACIPLIGL